LSAAERTYAEFLEAHKAACARGHPLLTAAGVSYLCDRLLPPGFVRPAPANDTLAREGPPGDDLLPCWDAEARWLRLGGRLLKVFRQPARNQTALLDVFQEEGWPAHIDDPLTLAGGEDEGDAKRRLHETIKNLNRGLPPGTIRFRGDGTGQGVTWEYHRRQAVNARRLRTRHRGPAQGGT
jgi:hypothetical protein